MDAISINALLPIPDNVWSGSDHDIVMDDNEFEILSKELFDVVPSNDFFETEFPASSSSKHELDFLDLEGTEMCMDEVPYQQQTTSMEDPHEMQTCQLNYVSDPESPSATVVSSSSDSGIINAPITFNTNGPHQCPYFPSLSSSELEQRMEKSISRLAMSMKRSELSRQKIIDNCSYERAVSFLGTSLSRSHTIAS